MMSTRKVDPAEFAELYSAGVPMKLIRRHFNCSYTVLKETRNKLNLPPRGPGRPPRLGCRCRRCVKAGRVRGEPQRVQMTIRFSPPDGIREGDEVELNVPENPRLHGALATVEIVTGWGAHVLTEAAATGRFRASRGEMIFKRRPVVETPSGEQCSECGSFRLKVSGTCKVCENCGRQEGCS